MESLMVLIILAVSILPQTLKFYHQSFGWSQKIDPTVDAKFEVSGN
jgi:predicted enzyme related to lactoylglutathione lyase